MQKKCVCGIYIIFFKTERVMPLLLDREEQLISGLLPVIHQSSAVLISVVRHLELGFNKSSASILPTTDFSVCRCHESFLYPENLKYSEHDNCFLNTGFSIRVVQRV